MTKTKNITFEQAMAQLDDIVEHIENGNLPLDDMVKTYKQGMELIKVCHEKLESAKLEIKGLETDDLTVADADS